ncbi:cation diffusion facilitator family transporter [Alicyclobacillus sp.]|uniref:cation diffusion facilitator family transporter n=1 Tax=Alicyclobacillus sp. TaxID=61169 RepID=UPI0025BF2B5B|nr:cation diffusion facilitator family transporter [Alicyclobacillus sp.]MCL6516519.1 cation diffusion facilitator family transporter [Alicyclobacillus sp.]
MTDAKEHRQAQAGAWASVLVNLVLTVGKGAIGILAGSRALVADAIHSAADLAGSVAVIVGLMVARKPPDRDHPYGHGKAELISSFIVAGLLAAAGLDVAAGAVGALFRPAEQPRASAAWAAAVAVVIKEVMFQYNYRLGRRLRSRSLMASAMDHRSDVFSSLAALVGILMARAGAAWGMPWMLHMDAVASLVVALLILKMGYEVATDAVHVLMDRVVEGEAIKPYESVILSVPGVEHIDELRVRDHGRYVVIDAKISVDAHMSVAEGHGIAAEVKERLITRQPRVLDVLVHVNPCYPDEEEGGR